MKGTLTAPLNPPEPNPTTALCAGVAVEADKLVRCQGSYKVYQRGIEYGSGVAYVLNNWYK